MEKAQAHEAAVKAEAMAIVAQAKKDIKLREEARGEMKKASTKDDIQALINKRLAQSFADRPKAPEKPKEAPPAKKGFGFGGKGFGGKGGGGGGKYRSSKGKGGW